MDKKILYSILSLMISWSTYAGSMGETNASDVFPMYIGAYGGYGAINGAYRKDGHYAQGRLAFGINPGTYRNWTLGIEGAVQSGNTLRLSTSEAIIDVAGGLPIQATLKPLMDLLFTVRGPVPNYASISYVLKGGIAYRQLNLLDRASAHDALGHVNGEFQIGIGYKVNKHISLHLLYQGIYSRNNAGITVNPINDEDGLNDIDIAHIPTQQAGLLGVEYLF